MLCYAHTLSMAFPLGLLWRYIQLLGTLLRERCDAERSECRLQALPHAFARFAFWPYGGSLVPISSTYHGSRAALNSSCVAKSSRHGGVFAAAQAFRSSGREDSGGSSSSRR